MTPPDMEKKPNWFVRSLIITLCLVICALIYFNFFGNSYYGIKTSAQITTPLLILIAFLTVLVLSEAFDNFSIGKLISLSRKVKEKEELNNELKKENNELRSQILTISTNVTQKQVNSTILLTDELAKMLTVKPANDEEKRRKEKEIEESQISPPRIPTTTPTTTTTTIPPTRSTYVSSLRFEEVALPKFLHQKGLQLYPIIKEAILTSHFEQIDPISEYSPIFDAYIKTIEQEVFIELHSFSRGAYHTRERIYLILSKINYYRTIKKANAFLFLVFYTKPGDALIRGRLLIEQLNKEFAPSISNGLLRIEQVEITQEEYTKIVEDK